MVQRRKVSVTAKHAGLAESGRHAIANRCKAGRQIHVRPVSVRLPAEKFESSREGARRTAKRLHSNCSNNDQQSDEYCSNSDQHNHEHQIVKFSKRLVPKLVADANEPVCRGLMLRPKYISEILSGRKTWEVRTNRPRSMPARIHLIPTGVGKAKGVGIISGEVCIKDAIPVSSSSIWAAEAQAKHRVSPSDSENIISRYVKKKKMWAWVLTLPTAYHPPRTFKRKPGQQTWVTTHDSQLCQSNQKRLSTRKTSSSMRKCKHHRR